MKKVYELLIIGGGLSACTFASNCIRNGFQGKIAIVESGRRLGGRSSTRYSKNNFGWLLNHGAPNFNIINKSKDLNINKFIDELLNKDFIEYDNSDLIGIDQNLELNNKFKSEFYLGKVFKPTSTMTELANHILDLSFFNNQIDFLFQTLITNLEFSNKKWIISDSYQKKFSCRFLVISSNLLLHQRSKNILKVDEIPLRKAIRKNVNKKIDKIIESLYSQNFIQRTNFLIYTESDYGFKDDSYKRDIHFCFTKEAEKNLGFERIIFQNQKNNQLGIVIHTKENNLVLKENANNDEVNKIKILEKFNKVFKNNPIINELSSVENISIMRWNASQPIGKGIPRELQICEDLNIAFCGDWLEFEGFSRIEGAISSGLSLSNKIMDFL